MRSVLIVKLGAIGDAAMVIPAAQAMHRAGYRVDWVCGTTILPILQMYDWIHPIAVDERALFGGSAGARVGLLLRLWRAIRRASGGRRYDVVATLYYDRRYQVLTLPVRAGRKFQLVEGDRRLGMVPGRRHTDEFARILLERPDEVWPEQLAPVAPSTMPRWTGAGKGGTRVVLAPAGARNLLAEAVVRRWPAESYAELARELLARVPGVDLVLVGGADDAWASPLFAGMRVTDLIGKLPLTETVAVLNTADVFVTHDTGPLHLAGVTECGIVAVFGPTSPYAFLPTRPGVVGIWGGEGFACRPCYDGRAFAACPANDCMRQVTVGMVVDEVLQMLEQRRRGISPAVRIRLPERSEGGLVRITA